MSESVRARVRFLFDDMLVLLLNVDSLNSESIWVKLRWIIWLRHCTKSDELREFWFAMFKWVNATFSSFCRILFAIRTWILVGDFREYRNCHVQWNKKWKPLLSTRQQQCNKVLRENFTTRTQDTEPHWTKGILWEKTSIRLLKIKWETEKTKKSSESSPSRCAPCWITYGLRDIQWTKTTIVVNRYIRYLSKTASHSAAQNLRLPLKPSHFISRQVISSFSAGYLIVKLCWKSRLGAAGSKLHEIAGLEITFRCHL